MFGAGASQLPTWMCPASLCLGGVWLIVSAPRGQRWEDGVSQRIGNVFPSETRGWRQHHGGASPRVPGHVRCGVPAMINRTPRGTEGAMEVEPWQRGAAAASPGFSFRLEGSRGWAQGGLSSLPHLPAGFSPSLPALPGLPSSPCSSAVCPCVCPHGREPSGRPSVAPRDGGSLSDSSSGESSCGRPRRPRGPSPSRVRFEDESARDAEVRYLERLQLRHRRALGSALPWPEPAGSRQPGDGAGQPKARSGDLVAGGKCSACGSFLGAAADTQAAPDVAKSSPAAQRSVPGDSRGPSAAQTEPKIRPLGPGGSPLWILPSRQRIHTEKIKETYIGDVTYIDEVDSALESTDTSDGCRTDSEEAGPRSPHLRGHRDPRTRGHRTPRAAPQPEARARKGTCVASGGPEDGDSGPGPVCPPAPGRTSKREDGEPHRHPGGSKGVGNAARPPQQPSEPLEPSSQLRTSTPIPGAHVPAPPPTKKACAQVPCRKALFSSSSRQAPSQAVRGPEPDAGSAAPPQPGGTAGPAERRGPCSPRWLPGSPFRALSTNNCNNTHGQDGPGTGRGERTTRGVLGASPMKQACDRLTVVPGTVSHPAASPVTPVAPEAAHPAGEGAGMPGAQPQRDPAGSTALG